jgi:hypothetical protein
MPLTIPSEHKVALTKLASFSDEQTQRLLEALRAAAPTIWPHALAKQIATTADLPLEDVTEILDTLISLIANRDQKNFSTEKVASDVANAMAAEHIGDIQPNSAEMANVEKRLREFLEVDRSLGVTSRALNVMTQHKHPFRSGRILTDIRTVFSTGDDPQPIAGLIVHNLQIATITDGNYETFVAALDSLDLRALANVINRAIKKEDQLKSVIQRAGLSYIEMISEEQE